MNPTGVSAHARRPPLATAVGVIGIVAGAVPLVELTAVFLSGRFAAWFVPVVQSMLPIRASVALALLLAMAGVDIVLGVGVLHRKRVAFYGMVLRSIVGMPIDYMNAAAGNRAGAVFGFTVNVFVLWALLRSDTRRWFSAS